MKNVLEIKDLVVDYGIVRALKGISLNVPEGSIVDIYAPIDVSNVALIDPKTKKPTRVGFQVIKGKKVRVAKKSGEVIK